MAEANLEDVESVFITASAEEIHEKLKHGELKIAIYGLGHVGSSIASVWLRAGAHVIGLDKSQNIVKAASNGITHIPEPGVSAAFTKGISEKRFMAFEDESQAPDHCTIKIICVPVLSKGQSADLSAVKEVAISIASNLHKGDLVVLNPSVPPGTTEEVLIPILEQKNASSLKAESDFYVVYNPERLYVGRAIEDIERNYPAIVAGAGNNSSLVGTKFYSIIFKRGVRTLSNIKTAEAEKLFEGVYRDVNIAIANELAKICDALGFDFREVQSAANSQPFCHIHDAGIGVGGACIPVYPQFVLEAARKANTDGTLISLARSLNDSMPRYAVDRAMTLLHNHNRTRKKKSPVITLLGLAFRGNVSDTRLSPTYSVINELRRYEYSEIRVHDPLVKNDPVLEKDENIVLYSNINEAIAGADLIIVVANHNEYRNLNPADMKNSVIYDGRGILDKSFVTDRDTTYESLGMGS
jgi:nucleotide sugar dehydrogenase